MEVDLIFQVAGVGMIVAVLNQVLVRSGREEQAVLTTLAGLIVVLVIIINEIGSLFDTIKSVFGNYGQCYRIGGDEFAVILRRYHNVDNLIKRFEIAVADKFKNKPCQLSLSLGYSKYENNDSFEAVIQRADANMYKAKKQNKALEIMALKTN